MGNWKLGNFEKYRISQYAYLFLFGLQFSIFYLNNNFFTAFGFYKEKSVQISLILSLHIIVFPITIVSF